MTTSRRPRGSQSGSSLGKPASKASKWLGADLDEALDLFSSTAGEKPDETALESKPENQIENKPVEKPSRKIYTVSELSTALRDSLREQFPEVLIQGEVADFKGIHRSGHLYFSLKDASAQMKAVMWKQSLQKVPFEIKGGLEVIVTGRIDYYGGSGSLQIVVERMEPKGIGALQLKLEQLKQKLQAEGLFDTTRKKKVSPLNWRIGIVTSKTTAALQDMLKIYRTRFPLTEIFLFSASVQGEKAPAEIVSAIDKANRFSLSQPKALDVLVITRGGGSYEDLYCFNDESIVRAIAKSKIPTISAVGHEIDTTLADFVADKRSATPSHAAQETVPEIQNWIERLEVLEALFSNRARDRIEDERQRVDTFYNRLLASAPQKKIQNQKEILNQRTKLLANLVERALEKRRSRLQRSVSVLDALSPLKVLDRGYSIVSQQKTANVLKSIQDVQSGDTVNIRLSDGSVTAKIS